MAQVYDLVNKRTSYKDLKCRFLFWPVFTKLTNNKTPMLKKVVCYKHIQTISY